MTGLADLPKGAGLGAVYTSWATAIPIQEQETPEAMTEQAKTKLLGTVLRVWSGMSIAIFGTIFTGYAIQTPHFATGGALHWLVWDDLPGHVALMLSGIYVVWAVFVWLAARGPLAYASFLNFTMWANLVHGLIMIPGAFEPPYHSKFFTDIPWVLILAAAIYFLRPAGRARPAHDATEVTDVAR